jgi:hypothetical protein
MKQQDAGQVIAHAPDEPLTFLNPAELRLENQHPSTGG